MKTNRNATSLDRYIGQHLREVRRLRGYSMREVGEAVGVIWQQIQKYENGRSRISASMLWDLSRLLKVSVSSFYRGWKGNRRARWR